MQARSSLFDLYGDHLLARGGVAPVASLIRLLDALGVNAPAVRTAVSRMVTQGWLDPVDTAHGPGYALTPRATARLSQSGDRIYYRHEQPWDGRWHLRVLEPVSDRARRERVRTQLRFLGMAPLGDSTWVGPRLAGEVDDLLQEEGIAAVAVTSTVLAPIEAVLAAFDVDRLSAEYDAWLASARQEIKSLPPDPDDRTAFAARSRLVHEWRKFLFSDPGLPAELLPADWAGRRAASYFTEQAESLLPAASRFVDACLERPREGNREHPGQE